MARKYSRKRTKKRKYNKSKGGNRRVKSLSPKRKTNSNKSKRNKSVGTTPKYRIGPFAPLPRRGESRRRYMNRLRRYRTQRTMGREIAARRVFTPPNSP